MRLFVFLLFMAFVVMAVDSQVEDSETDHPKEINLTLNPNWKPFNWVTNDTPEGVSILAARSIFEPHGVKVNIVVSRGTWGNVQKSVERGDDDGAIAAYNVTTRRQYSVFSNGYVKDPVVIFFPKERPFPYRDINDLIGHTFIVLPNESYGESVDARIRSGEIKVDIADNSSQAFQRLKDRSIDGFLYTYWGGRMETGYQDLYGNTTAVDNPDICIQISKKSHWSTPENMSLINAWETEVRKSGDVEKWLEQAVA